MILQRYQNMVEELYCQPKDEIIMGSFLEKQHGEQPMKHVRPKKRKTVKKPHDLQYFPPETITIEFPAQIRGS